MNHGPEITLLLKRVSNGETAAGDELFAAVYTELRSLAGWFLRRERPGHTLQPTALVNEVYLRMLGTLNQDWTCRAHFFSVAAKVMRRILVDYARSRASAKRTSVTVPEVEESLSVSEGKLEIVLAIDGALSRLEQRDARQAKIVELRFFGGLTEEEISLVTGTSSRTVKRDWKVAKAWLRAELTSV